MKRLFLVLLILPLLLGQSECGEDDSLIFLLSEDLELAMRPIPAGTFSMGSASNYSDDEQVHEITITQDFHLGKFEVTKAQWEAVMPTTPWMGQDNVLDDPDTPATHVTWDDAQAFITLLNHITGETFRLPTGSQFHWESAAGSLPRKAVLPAMYGASLERLRWRKEVDVMVWEPTDGFEGY